VADESSSPIAHEFRERAPVEPIMDGFIRIEDPEQLNVVGAAKTDESVMGTAVFMTAAGEDVEA
jgi:hypothetical protein